jgi:hypothetical protein
MFNIHRLLTCNFVYSSPNVGLITLILKDNRLAAKFYTFINLAYSLIMKMEALYLSEN